MKRMKSHLQIEDMKGIVNNDPERYDKKYWANETELYARIREMEAIENNRVFEALAELAKQRTKSEYLINSVNQKEIEYEIQRKTLAQARSKNFPKGVTIDQLTLKANKFILKKEFAEALKYFIHSIYMIRDEKPICKMNSSEQLRLAEAFKMKLQCNLELGKCNRSIEYIDKAKDDCIFLLEADILNLIKENKEFCESVKRLNQEADQLKIEITNQAKNVAETRNQRRIRQRRKEELEKKIASNDKPVVDANLCSELTKKERRLAINATEEDHTCPICMSKWSSFIEPRVAAILPCNHGFCVNCLLDYYNQCVDPTIEKDERCKFQCCLCRLNLRDDIFKDIAQAFVERNLLPYFGDMPDSLPFPKEYLNTLIVSKLTQHNFDLIKVSQEISNFIFILLGTLNY